MTTSPSLLGERLSHMIFHSPLDDILTELQEYKDPEELKELIHTSDFSLRVVLSIPLLAHDRTPIFRLATFCLLLEAGCDPEARGADSRCISWELDGLDGELRGWIEEEWTRAKSCRGVEGGYRMPEDVADWINDELTEIGRQRVELRKRVEDDKKREFAKLDEELAKFDRDMTPSPVKRARIEEELVDYEEAVGGRTASPVTISTRPGTRAQSPVPSATRQPSPLKAQEVQAARPVEALPFQDSRNRLPPKPRPPPPTAPTSNVPALCAPPASIPAPTPSIPSKPAAGQIGFSLSRLPSKPSRPSAASPPPLPSPAPESSRGSPWVQPISRSQSVQTPPIDSKPSPSDLKPPIESASQPKKSRLPPKLKSRLPPTIQAKPDVKPDLVDTASSQIVRPPSNPPPPPPPTEHPTFVLPKPGPPLVESSVTQPTRSINRLPPRRPPAQDLFLIKFTKIPSFITHEIFSHFLRNGPRSFDSVTRADIPYLDQSIKEGKIDVPYLTSIDDYPPLPRDVKLWEVLGANDGMKMGSATYSGEDKDKVYRLFNGKRVLNCLAGGGMGVMRYW